MHAPAHHPSLSDDAYTVLRDVALQPRSILLATTPRSASRELLEPPPALSPNTPRLSSAERHLLSHHREEVSRWLEVVAARLLVDGTHGVGSRCYSQSGADRWFRVATREELLAQTAAFLLFPDGRTSDPIAKAAWLLRTPRAGAELAVEVASIAHRFAPNPMARLCAAAAWLHLGASVAAARICRELLAEQASPSVRHVAWTWLGACQAHAAQWVDAADSYRFAYAASGATTTGLWALVNAIQAGDGVLAVQLGVELRPQWEVSTGCRESLVAGLDSASRASDWQWTDAAEAVLRKHEGLDWIASVRPGRVA
ncbi:MAG: hypothetical protein GC161_10465 [Planctomycetaceae bacterium]|nr:hypothetical protein [Planctomycetaceae bacterium]